ncbi:tetratricopeptide repeat-containing sensor histidine kinase [Geofilum sp. OHC36d9]|uniref:tetratricopeptide repeat-containing sensor histidine kinase n=1 Tax=Geofilum sp. OHC36d9 TaxID=3458413 RepID=UPI004034C35E
MIRSQLLFILMGMCITCVSQNRFHMDSLLQIVEELETDDERIDFLLSNAQTSTDSEGLSFARRALSLAEKNNFTCKVALSYELISLCQRKLGNYPEAVDASFKALKIYDELGWHNKMAGIQLQLGSHYTNDQNFENGKKYIKKAIKNFRQRKDTANLVLALINMGETYRLTNQYDSAEACLLECLQITNNNKHIEGYATGNLGLVYSETQQNNKAKYHLKKAIAILCCLNDNYSVSVYQSGLAKILIKEKKNREGEKLLLKSLSLAKKSTLKEQIRDISKELALFYENAGRYQEALKYRKEFEIYNDSLVNITNTRRIVQIESQYLLEKKETDIQLLKKGNHNKRIQLIFLTAGISILLILLFILYRLEYSIKKAYQKVSQQKSTIEQRDQEKAILLRELNHRVKNNLQMISSMFSLQARQLKGQPAAEELEAARRRVDSLMLIHQKLYAKDRDIGTHIRLKDYITELVNNLTFGMEEQVSTEIYVDDVTIHIDVAIPIGLIINELVTNSLKHATNQCSITNKKLKLSLLLFENHSNVHLIISDNGTGISDTNIPGHRSIGLKLIHSLTKQLNGTITQVNQDGCRWELQFELQKLQKL